MIIFIRFFLVLAVVKIIGPLLFIFILYPFIYLTTATILPFCITSFLVVSLFLRSPVYTILIILLSFILGALFLFSINIELIAFIFLIVYIGAVMMLFLFIIMLFNLQNSLKHESMFQAKGWNIILVSFVFLSIYLVSEEISLHTHAISSDIVNSLQTFTFNTNVVLNGAITFQTLYTPENGFLFIFLGLVLLFTMISAITNALLVRT